MGSWLWKKNDKPEQDSEPSLHCPDPKLNLRTGRVSPWTKGMWSSLVCWATWKKNNKGLSAVKTHLAICKELVFCRWAQVQQTAILTTKHQLASVVDMQLAPGMKTSRVRSQTTTLLLVLNGFKYLQLILYTFTHSVVLKCHVPNRGPSHIRIPIGEIYHALREQILPEKKWLPLSASESFMVSSHVFLWERVDGFST